MRASLVGAGSTKHPLGVARVLIDQDVLALRRTNLVVVELLSLYTRVQSATSSMLLNCRLL